MNLTIEQKNGNFNLVEDGRVVATASTFEAAKALQIQIAIEEMAGQK